MRSHLIAIGAVILLVSSCGDGADATRSTTITEAEATTTPASTLTTATTVSSTTTSIAAPPTTASTTTTPPTTTLPIDDVPPLLEVTAPAEGATFASSAVRFEGVTEPGATVVAWDRWAADVAADGTWHLVLILNPGTNIAQFTATDPAGNTTTVESVVSYTPPTSTTSPGTVAKTVVITFMPSVIPDQHYDGYCIAGSHLTDREGAWRCWRTDEEGGIYDPCFDTGSEVVCGASPINGDSGFVLDLTEPLPQDLVPGDPKPWILELVDSTYCFGISGAVGSQLGVRVHYGCDDGSWVLEDVRSGEVWTGHRLILTDPPDREVAEDLGWVPIRAIWQ